MTAFSVIIPTYGDKEYWDSFAERAADSVLCQTFKDYELIRHHDKDMQSARNNAADMACGDWLVFLDADDELEENFLGRTFRGGYGDIQQPLTVYVEATGEMYLPPTYIAPCDSIQDGNYVVVGAPVRRELFLAAGGFDDYPVFEDWALWLKMVNKGAVIGKTTGIYIIHRREGPTRNGTYVPDIDIKIKNDWGIK